MLHLRFLVGAALAVVTVVYGALAVTAAPMEYLVVTSICVAYLSGWMCGNTVTDKFLRSRHQ